MSTYLSHTRVRAARKVHRCYVCGERIEVGMPYYRYTGADYGSIYCMHFHAECWAYTRNWDDMDWETFSSGECSRMEIFTWVLDHQGVQ